MLTSEHTNNNLQYPKYSFSPPPKRSPAVVQVEFDKDFNMLKIHTISTAVTDNT